MSFKNDMWSWAEDLFPMNRSITGTGARKTLNYLRTINPKLKIKFFKTGDKVFDWTIPDEWSVNEAYISNSKGKKIIDFKKNNLHLLGYSAPINRMVSKRELIKHLYTLPDNPTAIPYRTSYYKKRWGFCLSYQQFKKIKNEKFKVYIDSKFKKGRLNYGEIILKGEEKKEIFFSTYICHPSMANNEVSGPVLCTALIKWLCEQKKRRYTYRFIFIPETIGSIAYLSKYHKLLKSKIIAGYNISCVGDNHNFSYLPSRNGNTYSDRVAKFILYKHMIRFKTFSFIDDRGSDERQYCSPRIDLPICSIMRSKFGQYPEYHTSDDNLQFISKEGLYGSFRIYSDIIKTIEKSIFYKVTHFCEPFLSKRKMRNSLSGGEIDLSTKILMNILAIADGKNDLIDISNQLGISLKILNKYIKILLKKKLIIES